MKLLQTIGIFKKEMPKDPKLVNAVTNYRYNKLESKLECLIKAIERHKEETPDHDIRICDQTLWSASEMINYKK
jgi:hypothetical protein|tara:strand:- start:2746 stop:2967 length:222 start_codon:yes stop_codon:yes gene_type:complete